MLLDSDLVDELTFELEDLTLDDETTDDTEDFEMFSETFDVADTLFWALS